MATGNVQLPPPAPGQPVQPGQPVVYTTAPPATPAQPQVVYVPQPVAVPPVQSQAQPPSHTRPEELQRIAEEETLRLNLIGHSNLFYWWPVWVAGYLMAAITYLQGEQHNMGGALEWFHSSSNLGVIFFVTVFLVILITNVQVRGLASAIVILSIILVTVLLAYFGWWDVVLGWMGRLRIHMNLGAYVWFSTMMFVAWALSTFIFDRMSYWQIKPGQITQEFVFGAGSRSYDTDGMVLEKRRYDVFRHWILGLGAGDLSIQASGAQRERIDIPNVLFIGSKVETIQRMIAVKPEEFGRPTIK